MAAKKTRKRHAKKHSKKAHRKAHRKTSKKRSKKASKKPKEIHLTAKTIMRRVCRSKHVPVSLRKFC